MKERIGTVYLLHFDRPYLGTMRHYMGWTTNLEQRLRNHREGTADSKTTRRAFDQGIGFELVRTWEGPVMLERQLKKRGTTTNGCPRCGRADRRREAQVVEAARSWSPGPFGDSNIEAEEAAETTR